MRRLLRTVDVLVIGAGPAGAVAAIELARRGVSRPLLAGPDPGGGPSHDVIVSAAALHALTSLGVELPLRAIGTIELRLGDHDGHPLPDTTAAVVDRRDLGTALLKTALDAGAEWVPGRVTGIEQGVDGGHRAAIDGLPVQARHVIDAGGAPPGCADGLVCVQRYTGSTVRGSQITMMLPAPQTIDPAEKPTCVWLTPGAEPGTVTVGAARTGPATPTGLLQSARSALAAHEPWLATARPHGPPVSGVLNSSFAPDSTTAGGRLRVGDAAGLVNPFTGEGLSYAVQSGLLAAQAVGRHLDDPVAAGRSYKRRLKTTFVGYFESARHAAHRYHLAWRVLVSTAGSNRPVFAKVRRAVLLPEGFSGLTATERMRLDTADLAMLAPFLLACDEVAISTVRTEWPFIARLLIAGEHGPQQRLRPAAPFYGALLAAGRAPGITRSTLAAAIELATLGALTFLGPMPAQPEPGRVVDWSLAASVLAGDFLLGQATRLVADAAPEISWSFADWLAELAALRSARIHPDHAAAPGAVFGSLLEFPARIGGRLGGAPPGTAQALRTYGEQCGHVFLHAEDLLAVHGRRTRLDVDLQAMIDGRLSAIPDLLPGTTLTPETLPQAVGATMAAGLRAYEAARSALDDVPHPPAARILRAFLDAIAGPLIDPPAP